MKRQSKAVNTNGNGVKPHEIVSGADKLDAGDMPTLERLRAQTEQVVALERRAIEARIELRGAKNFFIESISDKYRLGPQDTIASDGNIIRVVSAEAVKT